MKRPIAIFYHALFALDRQENVLPRACAIVHDQMQMVMRSGLGDAAQEFTVGINGGLESVIYSKLFIPSKAKCVYHGLESHAENLTIVEIEKWLPNHPGWNVLYFHAKGCTHPPDSGYGLTVSDPWRNTMNNYLIANWQMCVNDLENGAESVGCHFMRNLADGTQNIWAGNFWWATSDFLSTLPSIYKRARIAQSGIAHKDSRFEAEVWIGNGSRCPLVREYLPSGGGGVP